MTRAPDLRTALIAGVSAADPAAAVKRSVRRSPGGLVAGADATLSFAGHLQVLALGKAAPGMVRGLAEALPDVTLHGLEVTHTGRSGVRGMRTIHGGHPVPDLRSMIAGRRLLAAAAMTRQDAATVVLVSGGGSALAEAPALGVTLELIASVTDRLLREGASIDEMNVVRRRLSALKGGGLAAALRGEYVTLAVSDVVGSPPHVMASGPTVEDPADPANVQEIVERFGLALPATPPIPHFQPFPFVVVADGADAARATVEALRAAGSPTTLHTTELTGDVASAVDRALTETSRGALGVFAGETTVTVTGTGKGGRNQHAALLAAIAIEGSDVRFAAIGTDGRDGNSPAAGAVVDGDTAAAMRAAGHDPIVARDDHDSHTALAAVDATITTGPTGTNVGDVWIVDRSAGG